MPKNIVVCCDGTGNEFGEENSNVVKLYSTLAINAEQLGYYHPGVGTMGDPRARTKVGKVWSTVLGLAFGRGILSNVADAYRYLMDEYADGDRVYLFGFSRGAYTVRCLAGALHMFGLLCRGNEGLIPYVIRMFAEATRRHKGMQSTLAVAEQFKRTLSRNCPIHFVGVWDTVSSVGWIYDPVVLPFIGQNPLIRMGRQALSVDERRCMYEGRLWGQALSGQDIKQVWFAGVHSDVGGSYPEEQSGLSKIALQWMLNEGEAAGLRVDQRRAAMVLAQEPPEEWMPRYIAPDAKTKWLHRSLKGLWWTLEFLPHRVYDRHQDRAVWILPLGRHRFIPENSTLHASVFERKGAGYEPSNLPQSYTTEPWSPLPMHGKIAS